MSRLTLHGYWRSTAVYRTRIGLNLKGLAYDRTAVDLLAGDQASDAFRRLNPQGLVPALEMAKGVLIQSTAILEWLEETHPEPPLLPADPRDRATVRAMAAMVACDIHPLNNLRVLNALRSEFNASPDQVKAWIARWIGDGFAALEPLVARHGRGLAFGETPTLADCCLVPQVYSAQRYGVDITGFPRVVAAAEAALALPAFAEAHPDRQPEAPQPP